MAFGKRMNVKTRTGLKLSLAPFTREASQTFLHGFEKYSVTKYLSHGMVETAETEGEWYEKMIKDKANLTWGIWAVEKSSPKLVGTVSLTDAKGCLERQMIYGIIISDNNYWGQGIAGAATRALLWFAFTKLAVVRMRSAVYEGNQASLAAHLRVGYTVVFRERNSKIIDGKPCYLDNFECLNPDDHAWRLWWGDDRPTRRAVEARERTRAAIEWAEKNVELL